MSMIKVLHSADWHIDAPLRQFTPEQRTFLRKKMLSIPGMIADVCIREGCDLVLLAGDIFDGTVYTAEGVDAVRRALERMGVPVFISPGNHDFYGANSVWAREEWPSNVFVFNRQELSAYRLRSLDCRVYGAAFTSMDCPGLLAGFRAGGEEQYALMVLHGDPSASDSAYNPVTAAQVRDSGLDYLALGHVHAPGRFGAGAGMCAWPGCPMGHGWDETGTRGVLIAELEQEVSIRFIPLDVTRFYDLELPVGDNAAQALEELLPGGGSADFFRVKLTGESGGVDLEDLYRRFGEYPNLKLLDETTKQENLWKNAGQDTLEGVYFQLLRDAMDRADPQTRQELELTAKISRQILQGREVELP